jgi:Family of unknown function (DUF6256)
MSSSLIRQDVLPVGVGYLLVMGALGTGLWLIRRQSGDATATGSRPGPETAAAPGSQDREAVPAGTAGPRPDWLRLARHYAGTAIGGYLLLMAVVILYYYGVARVGGAFIASAFTGCALLIALTTPVFALASWLAERRCARPRQRSAGGPHPGSGPGPAGAPPAPRAPS